MTYTDLIRDALAEIGVLDETEQPSPEQARTALRSLTQMLDDWEGRGIDVGFSSGADLLDETSIEDGAVRAVKLGLAVELCPSYEREPTPRLLDLAAGAFSRLLRTATVDQLKPVSVQRPLGEGQIRLTNIETDDA